MPLLLLPVSVILPEAFRQPDKCKDCGKSCTHDICCEVYCTLCKA